jgi:hypothetical protein
LKYVSHACVCALVAGWWCGLPAGVVAFQSSAASAAIEGRVQDTSDAPIPGAAVTVANVETNQQWHGTADGLGRYRFLSLPLGRYRVSASSAGFRGAARELTLAIGQAAHVALTLAIESVAEAVTITAAHSATDLTRTQSAENVSPEEVQTLPLNGRNYLDLALLTPGLSRTNLGSSQRFAETSAVPGTGISVNGQRNLNNHFVVDGLSANDDAAGLAGTFFSQEVIREFQVVTSGGIAEFGRASAGTINIVTQSGTNQLRGRAYGFFRNDRFDARNAFAQTEDPLGQQQFGATLGGPLRRDAAFLFGNVEGTRNHRTGIVTIDAGAAAAINAVLSAKSYPGPSVATGAFATGFDTWNAFGRLDRNWSSNTRLTSRYSLYDVSSANARTVGALNDSSRGTALDNRDQTLAASLVNVLSSSTLNEARAQFTRGRLVAPVNDLIGPAVNISGIASFGTSTSAPTARAADAYEAVNTLTIQRGAHLWKVGADLLLNRVTIDFPGSLQGVYPFSSLANFAAGRYTTYQQAFGDPRQFQSNPNLGVFVQDDWRARDSLTLTAGVRYDLQWLPEPITPDTNNVSPRAGLSWAPGDRRTIVRVNGGVFFDRIPLRATSNALQRDGVKYRVAVLSFGQDGAPQFPSKLGGFPEGLLTSITTIDPEIQSGSSRQVSVQVEREITPATSATIGYQRLDGRHIILSRNANAPTLSAADAARLGVPNLGRPDPRFANVSRFESAGTSRSDALMISVRARRSHWLDARLSYTLSKAIDDAGNFFFSQPQDANDVHADWGPSDNDQRHRVALSGTARAAGPFDRWQFSWVFSYASALPFNVLAGGDRNNDTNTNDRPEGVGRNSARGFDAATLDLRVSRSWGLGRARLETLVEAFNLLNRPNFMLPNATFGAGTTPLPAFGRPTAAADPRQIQLGVRVSY